MNECRLYEIFIYNLIKKTKTLLRIKLGHIMNKTKTKKQQVVVFKIYINNNNSTFHPKKKKG